MSEFQSMQISENGSKKLFTLFKKKYSAEELSLTERKSNYTEFFISSYDSFRGEAAENVLVSKNSEEIIHCHSSWMDSWISFTWQFVLEEETDLMQEVFHSSKQKLNYLKNNLPLKKKKLEELKEFLIKENTEPFHMDPAERSYYNSMQKDQVMEINGLQRELEILKEIVPLILNKTVDSEKLLDILLIFARGGYGRRELTYSSDIDLGYCINTSVATKLEFQTVQELIKRMEDLFQGLPLDVASQYFELGEDLSRFAKTTMLHTIPSILEGREILGKADNLRTLKEQILEACPLEKMIRYLKSQMDNLVDQGNDTFFIKMGFGGIRHLQFVLWMVLIVIKHEYGNSRFLLDLLKENGWISKNDEINLLQALEFYFDLRNFLGLYSFYEEKLEHIGAGDLAEQGGKNKDFLDDQSCMAFLKLKQRFTTIDDMDRFRLYSIRTISEQAQVIIRNMLDRTIVENLSGFSIYKHLGTNRIIRFQFKEEKTYSSWNLKVHAEELKRNEEKLGPKDIKKLFLNFDNLFDLFRYIGKTGNCLSLELRNDLSVLIPDLEKLEKSKYSGQIQQFVFDLFTSENSSVAVEQMIDIATPLDRKGSVLTLLGVFLPEVNKMRYLLRNLDIHEYPLCIHSLRSLEQVEKEIDVIEKNEPELWRFIGDDDIFALKWSTFFHDVGKINPYRDHEEYGPVISTEMLTRLGWKEDSEVLDLIRLLISNHQSVVRFSQLSTYLDLGIIKFFDLAQRDPRKVVLLYLLNLSDFKSVNSEMNKKAAHLENFFVKTMSILDEYRREQQTGSVREIVNNYLDRMKDEIRISVFLELLLNQCRNKSLDDVIIGPLGELSVKEAKQLERHRGELEDSLSILKLAELDRATLEKHQFRFIQIVKNGISEKSILSLISPMSSSWNWFFMAVPNRYLLSSNVGVITSLLQRFEGDYRRRMARFSFVKGEAGEYDVILFHCIGDLRVQAKIAYALSRKGVNIENGKINKIIYSDGREGLVGFLKVSQQSGQDELSNIELETEINNLVIPPLNPSPALTKKKLSNVQVLFFQEHEKGYIVKEVKRERFARVRKDFEAVKIALFDAPFVLFKIMRSFEAIGVVPYQITITTIGNQIIDYFYFSPEDKDKMLNHGLKDLLRKYINAEITIV